MQVDVSPPFEIQTVREVGFLKGLRVAGPVWLSPPFVNDGDGVLKSEFTKLLRSFWEGKQNR